MLYTQSFRGSVDAFHVKTVDTTGAGDSFVGALLSKLVDDQSILEVKIYYNIFTHTIYDLYDYKKREITLIKYTIF